MSYARGPSGHAEKYVGGSIEVAEVATTILQFAVFCILYGELKVTGIYEAFLALNLMDITIISQLSKVVRILDTCQRI